jgi:hypothetical protein
LPTGFTASGKRVFDRGGDHRGARAERYREPWGALSELIEGLTRTEVPGEAVRTINRGSVKDLQDQLSKLNDTISQIQNEMFNLGGGRR